MKIAAVVVTYNRLNLLKKCINAIKNQTRKVDEIIVINNGSTDGTLEWLTKQNDLTVITQENSGSAGGQYTGIKTAYEKGYDWIWCMDDDCFPYPDCLENQLVDDYYTISGPRVVDYNLENVWDYSQFDKPKFYMKIYEKLKIPYKTIPFNGFLVSNKVVELIGFPIKELFINCDDVEYSYRAYKYGIKLVYKPKALLLHPKRKEISELNDISLFFYVRNNLYIIKKYDFFYLRTLKKLIKFLSYTIKLKNNKNIITKAIFEGISRNTLK